MDENSKIKAVSIKKAEWIIFIALATHLIFSILTLIIAAKWHSQAVLNQGWFFLGGIGIWFLSYLHLRLQRLAREEILEDKKPGSKLFEGEKESDPFSARTRLLTFEKWLIPFSASILGIGFLVLAFYLFNSNYNSTKTLINAPLTAAFLGGFAFFSLLIAKYALGMSEQKEWRILRAGSNYLFATAGTAFLCMIAAILTRIEFYNLERYLSYLITFFIGLIGCEILLNLVLDVYRPRIAGQEVRPPYDSRFIGICTGSQGFLRTISHTLDYQFGFKVSETWFYQFMEKAIAPILLFQIFTLYILDCAIVVAPHEKAVVERFGRPIKEQVLEPGLHIKWPWPIDIVHHYPVNKIQHVIIGKSHMAKAKEASHKHDEHGHDGHNKNILFTKEHHGEEDYFLLTADALEQNTQFSLMVVNILLRYRIQNVFAYAYHHKDPKNLIEALGNKVSTRYLASKSLRSIIGDRRLKTVKDLKILIQKECNNKNLGIEIIYLGILEVHPPFPVADAFENIILAMEQRETQIKVAETYHTMTILEAEGKKEKLILEAEAYSLEKKLLTKAEAERFKKLATAYRAGKDIFLTRRYLSVLENYLKNRRLYVVNIKNTKKQVDVVNLEQPTMGVEVLDFKEQETEDE